MTRQSYRHCLLRRLTSTFNGRGASRRCTLRRRARSRGCCWRAGRIRRRRRTMATHPPSRLQVVQQSRFSLESIDRSPVAALDLVRGRAERPQADERRGTFAEASVHQVTQQGAAFQQDSCHTKRATDTDSCSVRARYPHCAMTVGHPVRPTTPRPVHALAQQDVCILIR